MEDKRSRRYSREFKLEAVRRSFESNRPVTEVAHELGVTVKRLYKWRREFDRYKEHAFPGAGRLTKSNELEALRRENKVLREERDILKKSLIYFARDHGCDSNSSKNTREDTR